MAAGAGEAARIPVRVGKALRRAAEAAVLVARVAAEAALACWNGGATPSLTLWARTRSSDAKGEAVVVSISRISRGTHRIFDVEGENGPSRVAVVTYIKRSTYGTHQSQRTMRPTVTVTRDRPCCCRQSTTRTPGTDFFFFFFVVFVVVVVFFFFFFLVPVREERRSEQEAHASQSHFLVFGR